MDIEKATLRVKQRWFENCYRQYKKSPEFNPNRGWIPVKYDPTM